VMWGSGAVLALEQTKKPSKGGLFLPNGFLVDDYEFFLEQRAY
jgi:hypothetical protein